MDWSIFKYGTQIPIIFHEDFEEVNNRRIEKGDQEEITLFIDNQEYSARLVNIDVKNRDKGMLQLRYDSNNELKNLLKDKFKVSYNYLKEKYKDSEGEHYKTPENIKEYIEFYSTGKPFNYHLELVVSSNNQEQRMRDFLLSVLNNYQQARKNEEFAAHELGDLMRNEIPSILEDYISSFNGFEENKYIIKGSIGQGNWVYIPWIAIMDDEITDTTRKGFYIVYLFSEDMQSLYLTLGQGVTDTTPEENQARKEWMRSEIDLTPFQDDDQISLSASSRLGDEYERDAIAYIKYDKDDFPEEKELVSDLEQALSIYKKCKEAYLEQQDEDDTLINPTPDQYSNIMDDIVQNITSQGFVYPDKMLANFYLSLKTKPFVILAGISGTGKTKLIQLFAQAVGATSENGAFRLVSVRPDWSDGGDLLGFVNIKEKFQPGQLLSFAHKAYNDPERIYIFGLDEMNLARVEYYLSDILSVIETREKREGRIGTEFLMDEEELSADSEALEKYNRLPFPDNLFIVGTVNMDETTHAFSKKVLDRANTIEFSRIDLMKYKLEQDEESFEPQHLHADFLRSDYIRLSDCPSSYEEFLVGVIERLTELNSVLEQANMHVGYRVRDEICMYMLYNHRFKLMDFDTAFDFQLMQKILPRLQGSTRALQEVLINLFGIASGQELGREGKVGDEALDKLNEETALYPRSASKIADMLKQFDTERFTTYWI